MTGPKRTEPSNGGLMSKDFRYRGSSDTDVSRTWAKFRREQKKPANNVLPIKREPGRG